MAAELLDIEAKLDTSQVQGQLNQLSRTSGLQNLDRAIKNLETSMKRLTQQMNGAASTSSDKLLGRNGALLGRNTLARGLGFYWLGSQLSQMSQRTTGRMSEMTSFGGSIAKGAVFGPLGMAFAAVKSAIDNVNGRFEKLAEASDKLIEAKMKEWEAIDKTYNALKPVAEDLKTSAMSRAMSGEERAAAIERLKSGQTTANANFLKAMQQAEKLEGPAYDAAVETAQYWKDSADQIAHQLQILERDQNEYTRSLERQKAAAEKAAEAERQLADYREKVKSNFATDLRGYQHEQQLESIKSGFGVDQSDITQNIFTTQAQLQALRSNYANTLAEATNSDAPELFIDKINEMKTSIGELEDVLNAWQHLLVEQLDEMAARLPSFESVQGNLNQLQAMGGYTSEDGIANLDNMLQKMIDTLVQIRNNTNQQGNQLVF